MSGGMVPLIPEAFKHGAETVGNTVKDKTSSAFGRAYLFAWVVYNYKPLVVIFSLEGFYPKLLWLGDLMPTGFFGLLKVLGIPLLCAMTYVLISPSSEIVMRAGSRVADHGLRWLNSRLDRSEWFSSTEVSEIRTQYENKISTEQTIIRQQSDLIATEKRTSAENLDKFRSLLEMHLKFRRTETPSDEFLELNDDALKTISDLVSHQYDSDVLSMRKISEKAALNIVSLLSAQSPNWRMPWMADQSSDDYLLSVAQFVGAGFATFELDGHYQMTVRLTPAGSALIDALANSYAERPFSMVWRDYMTRKVGWYIRT